MASAYSTLRTYGDFIPPNDLDLVMKGLAYKQQQYDTNRARVDQTLAELSSIDLLKDVDRQYFHDRLNDFLGEVNKAGKLDLSDKNLTRNIEMYMKDALDNNVMEAYVSTQKVRKTLEEIDTIKQKKPELYSIQNEDFTISGIKEYMDNPNAGAKYNGQKYIPYKDVNKIINDRIKDADKFIRNIKKVSSISGDYFIDESNEIVDPTKLRTLIEGTLSPDLRQQLFIDARYAYKNVDDNNLRGAVYNDYNNAISKLNTKRKLIESDLLGMDKNNDGYKQLNNYLTGIKNQISSLQSKATSVKDMDINVLKTSIYTENLIDSKLKTYGGVISSEQTIRSNPTKYRYIKLAQALRSESRERERGRRIYREKDNSEEDKINGAYQVDIPTNMNKIDSVDSKFSENISSANNNLKRTLISEANKDLSNLDDNTFFAKYGIKKGGFNPNNPDKMVTIFKSKMENNPDGKLIPVNSKLRIAYDSQNYLNSVRNKANNITSGTVKNIIDDIIYGIYNGNSKYIKNSSIPEFQIRKDTKGNEFIQYTGKMVPWQQVFGNNEASLNKKIGNTGQTYRDLAHAALATELIKYERIGSLKTNGRKIEALSNYINKIFGGNQTNYKVKDSKGLISSTWNTAGAFLNKSYYKAKTLFNDVFGWDNTKDLKEYEKRKREYDKSFAGTQVSNHIMDAARDSANLKYIPIKGKVVSYNPVQHLINLTSTNDSSGGEIDPVAVRTLENGKQEYYGISTLRNVKKKNLAPTSRGTGANASIRERFNNGMELLNTSLDELYTKGIGKLPTDAGYSVDPKSKLGSELKTLVEGKSRFDKSPIIVDNHTITYKRNNSGGITLNVLAKEGKKKVQKEIDLSSDEIPFPIQKQLIPVDYNPAYDARVNSNASINYSATLLNNNREKIDYSKKNKVPIDNLWSKDDLYNYITATLPPTYLNDFNKRYGKAIDYLTRNKNTVSMVADGDGRFVKQWKVGDIVVKLEPTNIQYLSENQAANIYDTGLQTIQELIRNAVRSYTINKRSRELDEIVNHLNYKHGK